jgi:release factor glutamine methyltransferase
LASSSSDIDIAGLLHAAAQRLAAAGIEHADYEAMVLFAAAFGDAVGGEHHRVTVSDVRRWVALGSTVDSVFESGDIPDSASVAKRAEALARFDDFCAARAVREPLQYITGSVGFRFLELRVGEGVFIPRPETETVVQAGVDWLRTADIASPLVVDLCAGSGAVGLSLASEIAGSRVVSVEMDPEAYHWLERNAHDVVVAHPGMNFRPLLGDATAASTLADLDGSVDCVVSNPPYIPESEPTTQPEAGRDPALALYGGSADGMRIPTLVIARAAALLRPGGFFVMEHDISQGEAVRAALCAAGFDDIDTRNDLTARPRFSVGTARGTMVTGVEHDGIEHGGINHDKGEVR